MPKGEQAQSTLEKMSVYIPQRKAAQNVMDRLRKLGEKKDRSINYLVGEVIIQYLDREEKKG